jgi:hypothetical protein
LASADRGDTPIAFAKGQTCWRYTGKSAFFSGYFQAGQKLVATATGDAHEADDKREWIVTEAREVDVFDGKDTPLDLKDDRITIPHAGKYSFSVWPHAIQGYLGTIIICKL